MAAQVYADCGGAGAETQVSVLLPHLSLPGWSSGALTASDRKEAAEGEKEGAEWR